MPENHPVMPLKYWRLFELALAAIYACSIATLILIVHNHDWHPHLVRLLGRSWDIFVAQDVGSTSRGFLNVGIEGVVTIFVVAAMIGYLRGFAELGKHVTETAIVALFAIPTVAAFVYGTQFAWEVAKSGYQDHQNLVSAVATTRSTDKQSSDTSNSNFQEQITQLKSRLASAQLEVESRKNNIYVGDPAFQNIAKVLETFQMYRGAMNNRPCVIYITSPPDSIVLASIVARLSNVVSGCTTNGPDGGRMDPDVDEMTKDGMVPGVIVVHTQRGNPAGLSLQENLGSEIQTQLSYKPPKIPPLGHLYSSPSGREEDFIWLQFGSGVKWNSERFK